MHTNCRLNRRSAKHSENVKLTLKNVFRIHYLLYCLKSHWRYINNLIKNTLIMDYWPKTELKKQTLHHNQFHKKTTKIRFSFYFISTTIYKLFLSVASSCESFYELIKYFHPLCYVYVCANTNERFVCEWDHLNCG